MLAFFRPFLWGKSNKHYWSILGAFSKKIMNKNNPLVAIQEQRPTFYFLNIKHYELFVMLHFGVVHIRLSKDELLFVLK